LSGANKQQAHKQSAACTHNRSRYTRLKVHKAQGAQGSRYTRLTVHKAQGAHIEWSKQATSTQTISSLHTQ